jgi:hypothetical protein
MLPIVITEVVFLVLKILPVQNVVSGPVLTTASKRLTNTKLFIGSVSRRTVLNGDMKDNQE